MYEYETLTDSLVAIKSYMHFDLLIKGQATNTDHNADNGNINNLKLYKRTYLRVCYLLIVKRTVNSSKSKP